jgi:hypothetical protein
MGGKSDNQDLGKETWKRQTDVHIAVYEKMSRR